MLAASAASAMVDKILVCELNIYLFLKFVNRGFDIGSYAIE
jgi:hypothetical protein